MIKTLVKHRAPVWLVSFCILAFGIATYKALPREAAPDVEVPFVIVSTPYPGVSPSDVQTLITEKLETELTGLKDLKKMNAVSAEGVSLIYLEFETGVVIEDALQLVRDRVNRAKPELPTDVTNADGTEVREISFSDVPVLIVTLAGDADEVTLKRLAEDLEELAERVPGVLSADVTGGRERQIRVQIDSMRLGFFGLSMDDVIAAIHNANANIPAGTMTVGSSNLLWRVPEELESLEDIAAIAIKRKGDRPVFIRDVATVTDDFADRNTYARMNGKTAVSLAVTKRSGANIEDVANEVKALVELQAPTWPKGVTYQVLGDQSKLVSTMVSDLQNGIITALLLVVGVIMFFMGVRNSLFVAIAIPLSFLLGIIIISLFGMTLNMVVLFSLILVLGMLVDNAIVIVENVYRHAELGADPTEAAIAGTNEVAMAVTASTATTVAAFLPLVFWTGLMGEFMGYLPKTVIIVLISSLVVALFGLPVMMARWLKLKPRAERKRGFEDSRLMQWYRSVLEASIRRRYLAFGGVFAVLIVTFMAYGALNHGTEFFPETEPDRAIIAIQAPDGTDLEETDAIMRRIEGILVKEENIDVYVAEVGVSGDAQDPMSGSQSAANAGRITIDFLPSKGSAKPGDKLRVESTVATITRIREQLPSIPGAQISIAKENMGPPVGAPIAVEITGDNFDAVGDYAAKVRKQLSKIEGAAKLTDNYKVGRPELKLRIDRDAVKRIGANTRTAASTLRTALAGATASTVRWGDDTDDIDIVVELDPRFKTNAQQLLSLRIPGRVDTSPDTFPVPLASVARYELSDGTGPKTRIDQKLVVTISGQVKEGANQNEVQQRVKDWIKTADVPDEFEVRLGGANDEQKETQEFLGKAFLIAIFLILLVLVTQFNRFDLPLIVLISVILSMVGVLWGLIITGTPFGVIMTGLGVISLAGIVVNNAIVLLDYVQQLRDRGMGVQEALIQAGMARFRPVILTAATTMLGLIPMAIGLSIDFGNATISTGTQTTQWWGAMAVAVVFGLGFATVLTLVMVPTMYSITEDLRSRRQRRRERKALPHNQGPATR